MRTEREKMLAGELYNALDPELMSERTKARLLFKQYNDSKDDEKELRVRLMKELIPAQGHSLWIEPPFYCDYGTNIEIGDKVFFNFNCIILDVMKVTIGNGTMFGPSVQLLTAMHPMSVELRATGAEYAKAIEIGSDVWIGGGVIVCPGVTIGNRCVIGAGSVVTRDIPEGVFAAGNPCRVIKYL